MGLQTKGLKMLGLAGGVAAEAVIGAAHHHCRPVALLEHPGKVLGRGLGHIPVKRQRHHQLSTVLLQQGIPPLEGADHIGRPAPNIGPGMVFKGDHRGLHALFPGKGHGFFHNGLVTPVHTVEKAQGYHPLLFHIFHSLHPKLILQKMARPPMSSRRVSPIWQNRP